MIFLNSDIFLNISFYNLIVLKFKYLKSKENKA